MKFEVEIPDDIVDLLKLWEGCPIEDGETCIILYAIMELAGKYGFEREDFIDKNTGIFLLKVTRLKEEQKIIDYCEFIKCSSDPRRIMNDYERGCGIAWSGETCWTLYPHEDEDPESEHPKFIAYDIYLEETRLNNEVS